MIKRIKDPADILPIIRETMPDDVYADAVGIEDSPDRNLWGYYLGGVLVGCCGYWFSEGKYSISWTAVTPDCQHKGIGQQLLDKVIKELKKMGAECVYVETYEHPVFFNAIRFYMKNEFRLVGFLEDYLRDGSSYLYFKKILK